MLDDLKTLENSDFSFSSAVYSGKMIPFNHLQKQQQQLQRPLSQKTLLMAKMNAVFSLCAILVSAILISATLSSGRSAEAPKSFPLPRLPSDHFRYNKLNSYEKFLDVVEYEYHKDGTEWRPKPHPCDR